MIDLPDMRDSRPADVAALEALYPDAFPAEDLLPLVKELLAAEPIRNSLVAAIDGDVEGHVIFTHCGLTGRSERVALLGPLAVASKWQDDFCLQGEARRNFFPDDALYVFNVFQNLEGSRLPLADRHPGVRP